ncbi:Hypothetical predicted protein [Paramuricea clavata]|uniref:Uncharacterized protein n=1 Tax=Paramuricea clavata TaxID=317549 RepID=A0A7D9DX09_PARCT|nr:Hypothetical predicted protein [Paramuricea clavata]
MTNTNTSVSDRAENSRILLTKKGMSDTELDKIKRRLKKNGWLYVEKKDAVDLTDSERLRTVMMMTSPFIELNLTVGKGKNTNHLLHKLNEDGWKIVRIIPVSSDRRCIKMIREVFSHTETPYGKPGTK